MKNFQRIVLAIAILLLGTFHHAEAAVNASAERLLEMNLRELAELTQKIIDSNQGLSLENDRLKKESLKAQEDLKLFPEKKKKLSDEIGDIDKKLGELKHRLKEIEMNEPQLERDLQNDQQKKSELDEKIKKTQEALPSLHHSSK